jgi:hypothetical protein
MRIRRVVVRLDPTLRSGAMLHATALVAEKMGAELVGLCVEKVDLFHFAAFPFARELGFPSAVARRMDVCAMERALRVHFRQAQEQLALATRNLAVRWSFRVEHTSRTATILDAEDLVVVQPEHLEEMRGIEAVRVVHAGHVSELRDALSREADGILVLAGRDDALISETLRRLHDD